VKHSGTQDQVDPYVYPMRVNAISRFLVFLLYPLFNRVCGFVRERECVWRGRRAGMWGPLPGVVHVAKFTFIMIA
jgi:hypothetical protein